MLDHGGLVVLEVVIDPLQVFAGVGRRGNRSNVDDGLVSRCLFGGDAVDRQQRGPAVGGGRFQVILRLGQRIIGREVQQFDASAVFQGHAQRQEQVPVVRPLAVGIELAGAGVGQVARIEQRGQRLFITGRHAEDFGV
ncbi:hypothetical protein D3C73_1253360 [compost metagenome]